MAFFGFEQRSQGHPSQAPGFGAAPDPFASISQNRDEEDDAYACNPDSCLISQLIQILYSIDFDDTYDGLGDQLDEADDTFNDDTFGGGGSTAKTPGRDFDFFGNTSKVSSAINEEAVRFNRHQLPPKPLVASSGPSRQAETPYRTGYEAYKNPAYIPDLQVDASLWGTAASKPTPQNQSYHGSGAPQQPAKKMMSLEEVEAAMRSQPKKVSPIPGQQQQSQVPINYHLPALQQQAPQSGRSPREQAPQSHATGMHPQHHPELQNLQFQDLSIVGANDQPRPTGLPNHHVTRPSQTSQAELPARASQVPQPSVAPQILQRPQDTSRQTPDLRASPQPRQILQNPNRQPAQLAPRPTEPQPPTSAQPRTLIKNQTGGSIPMPIITHPSQLAQLSEEQRQAFMVEDAKRAKRNHKIYLLSKDNGLMTPQDKNFITRIQLQQLMTATGNVNEQDSDASLSEDFYYQVYNQIENRPRQNPHQPLSNFAQTYLFQTGGRQGGMGRRHNRGGDNHVHRMQQQVQRAVEAAKLKPKGKQLVIEGSLGKISFSNAKTPKPLLNIKRHDSSDTTNRQASKKLPQAVLSTTDRKAILKNIEGVYSTLMKMEDHDRRLPPQHNEDDDQAAIQSAGEWRQAFQALNQRLWSDLKVMEPIMPESTTLHPFIAFLSYQKGKKAIPRIFSHIDQEQRLTILTMIMVQLDTLDVIRSNLPQLSATQSPSIAREQIDLFLQTVMPALFSYVTEAPLGIVMGLLGLVIERVNLHAITRTRVGLEVLTMFLSQAEIIRKAEATNDQEWEQWLGIYNRLFDIEEPILSDIFPGSVSSGQDVYVWQFLATIGTGASPEQQQRLVLAVKYVTFRFRVDTISLILGRLGIV